MATVRAGNVWISSRTYPRVPRPTGSHRFTVELAIQNHRSNRSKVGLSLSDLNMVFDGRMMAYRLSFGPVSAQPPAVVQVGTPVPLARGVDYMCVPNDANDAFGVGITMPAHSTTKVRIAVTVVTPSWLDPYIPFAQQGLSAIYEPDISWYSPFLSSTDMIPVAPVRMTGPPTGPAPQKARQGSDVTCRDAASQPPSRARP